MYWHIGRENILLPEKRYALMKGLESMMRATEFVFSLPVDTNLAAHQMKTYLVLIDGKLTGAEKIMY